MGSSAVGMVPTADDESALQLALAPVLPMTLKNVIELGMLEILVGAGGKMLSASEVAAQLPTSANPDAPAMVNRMLRLLASYNVVSRWWKARTACSPADTAPRRCASGSPPTRTASPWAR
ncbi:hypothetical protein QYE76_048281 [Lolium multiflorum]|uniref:O-methyltransferase dimerisation domain-containing protein n=1 Tax=Lolium multiflorum TaxID=4521 RepID=A0AAD8QGC8_LOLMU|nr:hypothetical protein QYE76_048281 [Lolium multiflorum]